MGKSEDDKSGFSFAKLASADNYKKWAWEMHYSLESTGFWNYTLLDKENLKSVTIVLKDKDLKDDAKREHQKKRTDKITT